MPNKPTQDLSNEHGGILLMLKIIQQMAEQLNKGENVDSEHLHKVIEFLQNFADKCHHGKEEDLLFPALSSTPTTVKIINELLGEHKSGRDYIQGMASSLKTYQPGNPDAYHIAANMLGYSELLKNHIRKENELFKISDQELSTEKENEIAKQFEKLEKEVIGEGKHEEYHGWLEELSKIYLPQ